MEKEKINVIFMNNGTKELIHEAPRYLVKPFEDNLWTIEDAPLICRGNMRDMIDYLCYDYDNLDMNLKQVLEQEKITFSSTGKVNNEGKNIFKYETKIYVKKKEIKQK